MTTAETIAAVIAIGSVILLAIALTWESRRPPT